MPRKRVMITARTSLTDTPLIVSVSENQSVRPWMKVPMPERHDQRVDAEIDDEEAVDQADQDAGGECQEHGEADRHADPDVEHGDQHRAHGQDARDRQVIVAGGERDDQPERHHHQHRLRSEDRGKVGEGEKRLGTDGAEDDDHRRPRDDQAETLGPVEPCLPLRSRRAGLAARDRQGVPSAVFAVTGSALR